MAFASYVMKFFLITLFMLFISNTIPDAAAEEFNVGDAEGWRQPPVNHTYMYNFWASRWRFHVSDTLRFVYKNDSVLVVDEWGYYHCNSSHPISSFNDGNTVVALDKPSSAYFISGDPDRCKNGQRMEIEILPLHPPTPLVPVKPHDPTHEPFSPAASPSSSTNSGARVFGTSILVVSVLSIGMASCLV